MPDRYAAFISYAHRYQEWVATLQRNLESCLKAAGADPNEVFLDQTDLASGRSWVAQLQEGLAKAEQLISCRALCPRPSEPTAPPRPEGTEVDSRRAGPQGFQSLDPSTGSTPAARE